MTDFAPGSIIDGRYEIVSCLGEGGMGVVYEAVHKDMQRRVALKMLKATLATQPDKLARFRREAQVISALSHPNIVTVYSVGVSETGVPYIAMELLQGKSLAEQIKERGQLPFAVAVPLFIEICEALSHAHGREIIHRDLKPSNFVVEQSTGEQGETRVKVVDFGIAKILSAEQGLTQTSAVVGSVFYMSPGLCEGRAPDVQSDIYAIGCSLFEALTGRPPFAADSYVDIAQQHRKAPVPVIALSQQQSAVPPDLARVITCCLEKDSADRYTSVEKLKSDLESVLHGRPPQHIPAPSRKHKRIPGASAKKSLLFILILCTVALVSFAGIYSVNSMYIGASERDASLARTEANRLYNKAWFLINDHMDGDNPTADFSQAEAALKDADAIARPLYDPYLDGRSDWSHAQINSLKSNFMPKGADRGHIRRAANVRFQTAYQNFEKARRIATEANDKLLLEAIDHCQFTMLADNFDFLVKGGNENRFINVIDKLFKLMPNSTYKFAVRDKEKFDQIFWAAYDEQLKNEQPTVVDLARKRVQICRLLSYDKALVDKEISKMAAAVSRYNKLWAAEIRALKQP